MSVHRLKAEQIVARPRRDVFAFFSRAENLGRITPRGLRFEVVSADTAMRPGLRLLYRLRPLLGIPTTWVSEIARLDPPHCFVDVQVRGPYSHWEHTHMFEDAGVGDGLGTRITDLVVYELPFGRLGDLVNALVVRPRLAAIFAHRRRAIERLLPQIRAELHARGETVIVLSHRPTRAAADLPDEVVTRAADVGDPLSVGLLRDRPGRWRVVDGLRAGAYDVPAGALFWARAPRARA